MFGACPWLSHFAPSALNDVWRLPLAFIFRAFGAELCSALPLAFTFRAFGAERCLAPALAFIFRAFGAELCSAPARCQIGAGIMKRRRLHLGFPIVRRVARPTRKPSARSRS